MKKIISFLFAGFSFVSAAAQVTLPDNFKIGNYLEVFDRDSLKIYFNCTGAITDKSCALFYRLGKKDPINVNFTGEVKDFYLNDKIFFKGSVLNNNLEGYAFYYFKDGTISEEGNYEKNMRAGKWKYYYPSGKIEKIYDFKTEEPEILEAYKKNGEPTVTNGNGKISTEFRGPGQCDFFKVSGSIQNGKKNGAWKLYAPRESIAVTEETFDNGNFIEGNSNDLVYTGKPKIKIGGFSVNENVNLVESLFGCPGDYFSTAGYDSSDLTKSFYPKLEDSLNAKPVSAADQWLIIGLKLNKANTLTDINVSSSINDTKLENEIYNQIKQMTNWSSAILNSRAVASDLFFSVLADNHKIIVLPYFASLNEGK